MKFKANTLAELKCSTYKNKKSNMKNLRNTLFI